MYKNFALRIKLKQIQIRRRFNESISRCKNDKNEISEFSNEVKVINYDSPIYGIKEQLKFPYKKIRKEKPDILHIPHYNIPIFYKGKMIITIHDLTHLIYPEFLPNKFAYLYAKFMLSLAIK